jgi:hypothetical protein
MGGWLESRDGRITHNPLQAPEEDIDLIDPDEPRRVTTDPWGITDIPGLNGTPAVPNDEQEGEIE